MSASGGIDGIAIIGMAGRFPRARTLEELWRNLRDGVDCISDFTDDELEIPPPPELRGDPRFVKARGVLDEIDLFDAAFFDVPPRQAEAMDPQHRLFLETSWRALEDAGYDPQRYPGSIGVFGGVTLSSYFLRHLQSHPELLQTLGSYQVALGTDRDYLTTLVSYKLGLRGPSVDVQTACSTSLVAAVLACQSLLGYHCDMALAGGVSIKVPQQSGYLYQPGGLDSSDGRCRTFDARADGSVYGSGVGVVVLKRLEDALADGDAIHAVILGGALNNDGAARVGFTAPGVEGQAEVIANAQALAGVDPETIGYVECHGTGTALGDPIEVAALTRAFRAGGSRSRTFCALGSIKSNIGHCSAAAGVAGLIKAALAVRNRQIPPSLHFEKPNPGIDFTASPFYVSRTLADWTADHPLRAGVSSFGLGGTNAHLVLEEAPEPEPSSPSRPWHLLLLSARTETALETATDALAADLEAQPDRPFADVAFTAQVGRRAFAQRRVLVCRDGDDARQALAARDPRRLLTARREPGKRPVAFLFPGVGDHYTGMARGLYTAEPTFREHLDRICDLFKPRLGGDLREALRVEGDGQEETGGPDLRSLLGRGPHPPNPPLPSPSQPPGEGGMENLTLPKFPLSRAGGAGWERGLGGEGSGLARTLYAQPAVFAVEIALAHLWMEWGVVPDALFGYSLGEYTAACLAGVMPLEDAVLLVAERARLLDGLPGGRMLAVPLSEAEITPRLAAAGLDLAAVNAPNVCVAAGPEDLVLAFRDQLAAEGIPSRLLTAEHAFHSRWMEPLAPALTRLARGLRLAPPKIPYISDVTGAWITAAEATDPGYWARHLCRPVRFAAGLAALWKDPARVLLEVGPGFGLSTLAMQSVGEESSERLVLPSLRNEHDHQPDEAFLLGTLGKLWLAGVEIDWQGFWRHEQRHRVRLPGYPFERSRFWIDLAPLDAPRAARPSGETETISTALSGGDGFTRARDRAPGRRLVLIEDDETARRIARLRELEALGAEVVVLTAAEAAALPTETPVPARSSFGGRHARPRLSNAYVAPESAAEIRIAAIFEELLGIAGVGAHDSFFDLGGHSLLATQVLARLRDRFGVELQLPEMFAEPTAAGLARHVQVSMALETPETPSRPVPVSRNGDLPLSSPQERLWFLDRLMPGNPFYNLAGGVLLNGPLQPAALRAAFAALLRRHEVLRTGFPEIAGRPLQGIEPEVDFVLPLIDLSALPAALRDPEANRIAADRVRQPFDLARPPLLRGTLLRLGTEGEAHALLYAIHHIVSDGWSLGILLREIAALYSSFASGTPFPLPPLPLQYADFAVWQRGWMTGDVLARQLGYWRDHLAGAPITEIPSDFPRPAIQTFRGATRRVSYPAPVAAAVTALARRSGASPFMVLLAGFLAVLARWTGQEDLVVGTPVANRRHSEVEGLIGLFVNTLVLRTDLTDLDDLNGDPSVRTLLERVKTVCLGAYAHQDLPFEQLVEELQPQRDLARNPLFQVVFNLLNTPLGQTGDAAAESPDDRLTMTPLTPGGGSSLFDLQGYVTHSDQGIDIAWEYATDLYAATTVERISRSLEAVLAILEAHPEVRLSDLPLLSDGERHQITAEWNDTSVDYPHGFCLHELFAAQAERTPNAVAAVYGDQQVTYRDLLDRTLRLAGHLAHLGVKPDGRVGVLLERSLEMIIGLLGVLQAGAAYVPLDSTLPAERLATMAAGAGLSAVLVQDRHAGLLPPGGPPVVRLDVLEFPPLPVGGRVMGEGGKGGEAQNLAYVLYTSGSTGTPKGVMISHQGIVNRLLWMQDAYRLTAADRVLQKTPFSFDVSVWEFFWPLLTGASLVFAQPEGHRDPRYLADLIAREKITTVHFVPSMLDVFLETPGLETLTSLRRVVASGEALPPRLVRRFFSRLPHVRLHNLYGPTEASVDVSFWPCVPEPPRDLVPIGRPIANHHLHVVDRTLAPQPIGIPGELLLGGPGLARGYLGRPDLTAAVFIPDPFGAATGERLYRTGDLVRRLADGTVHYLGRIDHQVKIRGFRIELGEIEAALTAHPDVHEAVAAAPFTATGERGLVAYVIPAAGGVPDPAVLRTALAARLPEPMVPSQIVILERLPLTRNGKVDRRALPAPEAPVRTLVAPRDPVEEKLAALWQRLLGLPAVSVHDNFFDVGGHSLLATRLIAAIREEMNVEIPVREIFEHPVLADQALALAGYQAKSVDETELAQMLHNLDELSDEDVERLLAAESEAE
jgi:amino acid adenylation domain-containing protein